MKNKDIAILTAALILPGGLIALGLWKAYELYKTRDAGKVSRILADPTPQEDAVTKDYVDRQGE